MRNMQTIWQRLEAADYGLYCKIREFLPIPLILLIFIHVYSILLMKNFVYE